MNCRCGHPERAHVNGGRCRVLDCPCERFEPGDTLPAGERRGHARPSGPSETQPRSPSSGGRLTIRARRNAEAPLRSPRAFRPGTARWHDRGGPGLLHAASVCRESSSHARSIPSSGEAVVTLHELLNLGVRGHCMSSAISQAAMRGNYDAGVTDCATGVAERIPLPPIGASRISSHRGC
jgi:hypothetical protein